MPAAKPPPTPTSTRKDADVFELRELNTGTPFYNTVMQEGVRIA